MLLLFAAIVGIGYLTVSRFDVFLSDNTSLLRNAASYGRREIRIGAQTPDQLKDISSALQFCSDAFPYIDISCKCSSEPQILHKLEDQKLDIAILADMCAADIPEGYRSIHVIYRNDTHRYLQGILSEKKPSEEDMLVVWNPAIRSRNRDRVLLMIENENRIEAVV